MDITKVFQEFDAVSPESGNKAPKITVPSECIVEIQDIRFGPSEDPSIQAIYYVVEFKIVKVLGDFQIYDGHHHAWVHNTLTPKYGVANVKQFIGAALGYARDSEEARTLTAKDMKESYGDDQPLKGLRVRLKTTPMVTKNDHPFTVHDWAPV